MLDEPEACTWSRVKPLIWETSCKHQIGTPRSWEPKEGEPCMCCKQPVRVAEDNDDNLQV